MVFYVDLDNYNFMTPQDYITLQSKKFDKQFQNLNDSTKEGGYDAKPYVKNFLTNSLHNLLQFIVKEVEKKIKNPQNEQRESVAIIYNQALDDIISLLTLKK